MASGNMIVLPPDPKGVFLEGTISGTPKPGTVMEVKATALINNRPVYQVFSATSGYSRAIIVLRPNPFNGMLATDAAISSASAATSVNSFDHPTA